MGHALDEEKDDRGTVCVKYLLFLFNFFFWVGGAAVIAMGVWTLMEKSSYITFLANSTLSVSAYILLFAGGVVMITGFLGCCSLIREHKTCLLIISEELKESLNETIVHTYGQPGMKDITYAVDNLQQDFRCCGSTSYEDWSYSLYINTALSGGYRKVPDSCCKTMIPTCGERDHPSNIYKVEGGCITKLEEFIQEHLLLIGAVSIGIACFQLAGVMLSACFLYILYKEEKEAYNAI
ncbi:tetraspanin-11-like isoform X2 [Hyla sarda]|uniref:tetraspanin-11-like isoform X2 n=1 Tax=Hyla sarda TaxID=327740 RepID=UPI0024C28901|nr:tetraspanin-11-like isoform X2 [Hyla sarda]